MAIPIGTERPCKKCGMRLIFLEGQSGPERPVPAQKVRSVYVLSDGRLTRVEVEGQVYVNHYETCPYAREFSRRGGEAGRRGPR